VTAGARSRRAESPGRKRTPDFSANLARAALVDEMINHVTAAKHHGDTDEQRNEKDWHSRTPLVDRAGNIIPHRRIQFLDVLCDSGRISAGIIADAGAYAILEWNN